MKITDTIEKIFNSKNHIFITGKAGTGKTTLLKYLINEFEFKDIHHIVLAPTGVAALHIGGKTIHSFFEFTPDIVPQEAARIGEKLGTKKIIYKKLQYLIIDEISMVRADIFDAIDIFLRKARNNNLAFGGVQIIISGDLYQLPPIVKKTDREFLKKYSSPYFFSSYIFMENSNMFDIIRLDTIHRQTDTDFINVLNHIRNGRYSQEDIDYINNSGKHTITSSHVILTTTNSLKNNLNSQKLSSIDGELFISSIETKGYVNIKETTLEEKLYLKVGARVMFTKNHPPYYINGTLGYITEIQGGLLYIETDDGEKVSIDKQSGEEIIFDYIYNQEIGKIQKKIRGSFIQYPIKLAWAITIHKAQGMTYNKVAIDLGDIGCFTKGQAYVALSRCKTFAGLALLTPLKKSDIISLDEVISFENKMKDNSYIFDIFDEKNFSHSDDWRIKSIFEHKGGIDYYKAAYSVIKKIHKEGGKAFIVGGYCRNTLSGNAVNTDIDISTDFIPENIEKYFHVVNRIGQDFGVLVIKEFGYVFEISTFRKDVTKDQVKFIKKFRDDANRRDFTINAIYLDPITNTYHIFNSKVGVSIDDIQNGQNDLNNKIIRFIGQPETRIQEDPLRLIRYVRFKASLNLIDADDKQYDIVKKNFQLLKNIPFERIKTEFEKILIGNNVKNALDMLLDLGFFDIFIPEISKLIQTPGGPKYHLEGNVWIHTGLIIESLKKSLVTDVDMYWCALFHDVGKYETFTKKPNGEVSYIGHEKLSQEIFLSYARDLKFTSQQIKKISYIIKNHLLFGQIPKMKPIKSRKLFLHPYWNDCYTFCKADHLGRIPSGEGLISQIDDLYQDFMGKYQNISLYTGDDILSKYPHLTGVEIGKKLSELNDHIIANL